MLIREVCAVAFYCPRCGRIHVHDVPCFALTRRTVFRCESCGHAVVVLTRLPGGVLAFSADCVACGEATEVRYTYGALRRKQLEKVYCARDHFELGYIGRRKRIEEFLAFNRAEFEALHPNDGKNFIEKQHVLLEAMNRIHELAAHGDIFCPCGHETITADLRGNSIVLTCEHCGSDYVLRAETSRDLVELEDCAGICLEMRHFAHRR